LIPTIHPAYMLRSKVQLSDVIAADLAKAWTLTTREPIQREQYVVVHPSNPTPLDVLVRRAIEWMHHWRAERCTVSTDIETSGLSLFRCDLYSIALSGVDGNDLGLGFTFHDLHTLPWEAEKVLVQELRLLLADADVPKAFHNSPFDKAVLAARCYQINGRTVDTQGLHLLVQPDIPHDLGFIGHQYLEVEPWKMSHEGTKMAHSRDIVELLRHERRSHLLSNGLR
jgi:DNA polymerase I-like protein with 3'-5' exonuclease and polymerase domains